MSPRFWSFPGELALDQRLQPPRIMPMNISELLRRLALLGLPLAPLGCSDGQPVAGLRGLDGGNVDTAILPPPQGGPPTGPCPRSSDTIIDVHVDWQFSNGVSAAALVERCRSAGDCNPLCIELSSPGFAPKHIITCDRIPADAGAAMQTLGDAGDPVRIHLVYSYSDCTGRRPEGLVACAGGEAVGGWLARAACLEGASVPAFQRLIDELQGFQAPASLIRRAQRARRDEVRHHGIMSGLAQRLGGVVAAPMVPPFRARSLEEMAVENAVEGCVRETFGASVAAHQARRAAVPEIRQAMAGIARDEAQHALLAWDVDRWAWGRMDRAGRKQVRDRRRAAAAELLDETRTANESSAALGLPDPARLHHLAVTATRELWAMD
jgi:hypothetical protein